MNHFLDSVAVLNPMIEVDEFVGVDLLDNLIL